MIYYSVERVVDECCFRHFDDIWQACKEAVYQQTTSITTAAHCYTGAYVYAAYSVCAAMKRFIRRHMYSTWRRSPIAAYCVRIFSYGGGAATPVICRRYDVSRQPACRCTSGFIWRSDNMTALNGAACGVAATGRSGQGVDGGCRTTVAAGKVMAAGDGLSTGGTWPSSRGGRRRAVWRRTAYAL